MPTWYQAARCSVDRPLRLLNVLICQGFARTFLVLLPFCYVVSRTSYYLIFESLSFAFRQRGIRRQLRIFYICRLHIMGLHQLTNREPFSVRMHVGMLWGTMQCSTIKLAIRVGDVLDDEIAWANFEYWTVTIVTHERLFNVFENGQRISKVTKSSGAGGVKEFSRHLPQYSIQLCAHLLHCSALRYTSFAIRD